MRHGLLVVSGTALTTAALAAALGGGAQEARSNAAAQPASTAPVLTPVHVRPSTGGPRTRFSVSFRAPAQTGTIGQVRRWDVLTATGPSRARCVSHVQMTLPASAAGSTERARLVPGSGTAHWCTGTFGGVIRQTVTTICGGGGAKLMCPMLLIHPRTVGRFRFVVKPG
jgi:hypothetical protein